MEPGQFAGPPPFQGTTPHPRPVCTDAQSLRFRRPVARGRAGLSLAGSDAPRHGFRFRRASCLVGIFHCWPFRQTGALQAPIECDIPCSCAIAGEPQALSATIQGHPSTAILSSLWLVLLPERDIRISPLSVTWAQDIVLFVGFTIRMHCLYSKTRRCCQLAGLLFDVPETDA